MLTKEFMKQDVSHFLPGLHPSHLGWGKEDKQDTSYLVSEESASGLDSWIQVHHGKNKLYRKYLYTYIYLLATKMKVYFAAAKSNPGIGNPFK